MEDPNKDAISHKGEKRQKYSLAVKKEVIMQKDTEIDPLLADFKSMKRGFENGAKTRPTSKV